MQNKEYWEKRALNRLNSSEKKGEELLNNVGIVYNKAIKNVDVEIKSIYKNYAKKGILEVKELQKALNPKELQSFKINIRRKASVLGLELNEVYDERYLMRLSRLEALKQQIFMEIYNIPVGEQALSENTYTKIVSDNYRKLGIDMERAGVKTYFAKIDKATVKGILNERWLGKSYSERIWKNSNRLARELPEIIGGAIASGQSYIKTAKEVEERFDVSKFEASRLVRTETNYFHNQSELEYFVNNGFEEYIYSAILDKRTSKFCNNITGLDGKIFKVKDAKVGVNYPPLHPNCRSMTLAVTDEERTGEGKAIKRSYGLTGSEVMEIYTEALKII